MKKFIPVFSILFLLLLLKFVPKFYVLSSDNLNYLPSFSQTIWSRPHNFLLADPLYQFEPWRNYTKSNLLHGRFPLWNNQNAGGQPFFANPQTAVLFPLNFFYYLLPVNISLTLIYLSKLFLLGFFSFLYLRVLKIRKEVSILGSLAITFSAFPIVWLQWPQTNVYIFFPLLLYIVEKGIKSKNLYKWVIFSSFIFFLQVLGGHPETLLHASVVYFLYVVYRSWSSKTKILHFLLGILIGLLFASFQIIPFLEYLLNSYTLVNREHVNAVSFLSLKDVVLNVFPFLLGAPQLLWYKSLSGINFQEAIGGYAGLSIILISIVGIFALWRKNQTVKFWAVISILSFFVAYGVWPFNILLSLPILKLFANQRMIAFAGFSLCVLASLTLNNIYEEKKAITMKTWLSFRVFALLLFLATLIPYFLRGYFAKYFIGYQDFFTFLQLHIFVICLSTVLILVLLIIRSHLTLFLTGILILFQTFFLFSNYNTITSSYYQNNPFTAELKKLKPGRILEIGNPSLPPNLNLIYGLESAESYDAIDVREYKVAFDKAFPQKNHWGNVESFTLENLRLFGIQYLISDYDINEKKIDQQSTINKIVQLNDPKIILNVPISGSNLGLKGLRILTANFNRKNSCLLLVSIYSDTERVYSTFIKCSDIRDKMFYSISDISLNLEPGHNYRITFESPNSSKNNSIGLWTSNNGVPFAELLVEDNDSKPYNLIWNNRGLYIFGVPGSELINVDGSFRVLQNNPENMIISIDNKKTEVVQIKKTYYPGWEAKIDGKVTKLLNIHPFIGVMVPEGKHTITLEYRPNSFKLGLILSGITFTATLLYFMKKRYIVGK